VYVVPFETLGLDTTLHDFQIWCYIR